MKGFHCKIKDLDAYMIVLQNGLFDEKALRVFTPPSGLDITSLDHGHGIRITVAKNTHIDRPLQLVNIIDAAQAIRYTHRIEVSLDEGASLQLIHCDESFNTFESHVDSFVKVQLQKSAFLEYCNFQNLNNLSVLHNQTEVEQAADSRWISHSITLNGKSIEKEQKVALMGSHADAEVYGLYLLDEHQYCSNRVYIDHQQPECHSRELFKGILDDSAKAFFNGHIHVAKHAQKTQAFQSNKNLLLTDKARMQTQPFLEIYADDVQCSHGATVGQLDEEALFYLRSRAIPEKQARTLLMFAFANEVVRHLHIDSLQIYLEGLIKRRLNGETLACESCVFDCEGGIC